MRALFLAAVVAAASSIATLAHAEVRKLTVEEAVQLADDTNPAVAEARSHADAQRAAYASVRGRLLPSIRVTDELQHWNGPFAIPFGTAAFNARDTNTNTFTASAAQPLFGLGHLAHEAAAQASGADASAAQVDAVRGDVRAQVQSYFVQLFEARALEQIARASEEELAEQVTVAEARLKAGVLTRADVLRVRVSQANAKQQEIQAHAQGEIARANLLGRVGLPVDDRTIDFAEPTKLLAASSAPLPPPADAERMALAQRPDLAQRRLTSESAHHTEVARAFAMVPDVDLEGAYIRTDGSVFNPANAAFIGVKAQWAIWEWGATFYAKRAAEAEAQAAHFATTDQERRVSVEVASALAQSTSSAAAVEVARQTIESADEAYRVTKAALAAGTATTTDLLDSQAALTQARLNLTRAEYERALTHVTLVRVLGVK